MSDPSHIDRSYLEQLVEQLEMFNELLRAEQKALRDRDTLGLEATSEAKLALGQALTGLSLGDMLDQIAAMPAETRQTCEALHTKAVELARSARDSNTVNGIILRRTQQSLGEVINILSGRTQNALYDPDGQKTGSANHQTIAKA